MEILVCVKRVPDTSENEIEVNRDGTDIDRDGFASVAFHSFPDTLAWDAYSGDYGPNFFGHALNTATYVIDHPEFGWQAFGDASSGQSLDAFLQQRVFGPNVRVEETVGNEIS